MIALILSLVYIVSGQISYTQPVYSRIYLQGLNMYENTKKEGYLINKVITDIEDVVIRAAKAGMVKYTSEPFEGCEVYYNRGNELGPFEIDKDTCENIVNRIHILVSERFPDSEIIYDGNTKQYTLKWD